MERLLPLVGMLAIMGIAYALSTNRKAIQGRTVFCNAQMTAQDLKRFCRADAAADQLLASAMTKLGLSARAYTRILKVARTIADLADVDSIGEEHLLEAIQYRTLDRSLWM